MYRITFNSNIITLSGNTFLVAVDKALYYASVVIDVIYVWRLLNHFMAFPSYLITHPDLNLTEFGSTQISFV